MLNIPGKLAIPESELRFTFSRSSGPGGQNVNKVESRVTLWFDIDASPSLTRSQKQKIRSRLASRINEAGFLSLSSSRHRTQKANREDVMQRLQALMEEAFKERPVRKKTRIPRRAKEKRLRAKKRKSMIKSLRGKNNFES